MVTDKRDQYVHNQRIQHVQRYIRQHIDEPLDRNVLANVAGFSIPHFHRVFTACTGESAASYVRRLHMERAGRKLRMGAVDIMEIALAAGYASHAAFSKAFKKQFGISPSVFRSLNCAEATQLLRKGKAQ
ncbi:MAG: AraC family transcriptional regulator [Chloroflexi bacterium AL-W]|nr:AraC family transcriptional regulator [Chloroflexi bacterium AL-N1]NOK71389.1 AraC family transcriptional regulator [Chloroflexi bacterium AL-N10]NOK78792.1 AraC family transcriptional regulator [Chloroflexi bacterium AL-N5]NOK86162.1 AraC family transcriptional regulator [Chloroflexi bacterium AL-W]NOK93115.1 AraC family transcriptional regulator [Chloroflexi bacterium AL-N15]